jgi:integrase
MASIFLKPKSRFWFASFKDHQGVWRNKSTKTGNKTQARKIAETFERVAARKLNAQKAAEAIRELYHELSGVPAPKATATEFCNGWLRGKSKEKLSPATVVAYENTVRKFLDGLGERAGEEIGILARTDIVAFRNHLGERLSVDSVNKHLKIVRMLLKSARNEGFLLEDPSQGVKLLKGSGRARLRRAFSLDELRKILAIADAEWQSLIKLGIYSGQRLGDLAGLTWNDVLLSEGVIRIRSHKTNLKIEIPIVGPLQEHLSALHSRNGSARFLHPQAATKMRAQRGRTNSLSNDFIEILVEAGLREKRTHQGRGIGRSGARTPSDLSFHSLRHTAVSMLKHGGVPDAVVMELVGHESAAMSARYTHTGTQQLAEAIQKLPQL